MHTLTLGRTNLRVTRMGLGCGGFSRIGQRTGASEADSIALIQHALDQGINFIDTAEDYGNEALVGKALQGRPRDSFVISTKKSMARDGVFIDAAALRQGLEDSLQRLQLDHVDIYHLHAVRPEKYEESRDTLVPELLKLQGEGKLRYLGITEGFHSDTQHHMLSKAVHDDCWDVMMVGYNMLNTSARDRVLAHTQAKGIGTLAMFAVRKALTGGPLLGQIIDRLIADGLVDADAIDRRDPLGFVLRDSDASTLVEAAYRFCLNEPGLDVILSGTGNRKHLDENIAALSRPPLPEPVAAKLRDIFARVDSVSGQ